MSPERRPEPGSSLHRARRERTLGRPFDPDRYRDPRPLAALMHLLSPVNRHVFLGGLMRVRHIELPAEELSRLRGAVNRGTAAFLGPNHPEYLTDWLIDKEISARVSPLMAHWATQRIVNAGPLAQAFFLRCNLIANVPGGLGREYSIRWAQQGHGVLLHPEGRPTGQGDRIGTLFPGIVDMAWATAARLRAARDERPVYVVSPIWKLRFDRDATRALEREIEWIEGETGVESGAGRALEDRLGFLLCSLLRDRRRALGFGDESVDPSGYFDAQQDLANRIWNELDRRYGPLERDFARAERSLHRAIRAREQEPADRRRDLQLVLELTRISGLDGKIYGGASWSQESIAEILKLLRASLPIGGRRNRLHNAAPRPAGTRTAHVRIPQPMAIPGESGVAEEAEAKRGHLDTLRTRMQETLDALNRDLDPLVRPFRRANPLAIRSRPASAQPT